MLAERFRGNQSAEIVLQQHEDSPQTWEAPLTGYVREVGVDEQMLPGQRQHLLVHADLTDVAGERCLPGLRAVLVLLEHDLGGLVAAEPLGQHGLQPGVGVLDRLGGSVLDSGTGSRRQCCNHHRDRIHRSPAATTLWDSSIGDVPLWVTRSRINLSTDREGPAPLEPHAVALPPSQCLMGWRRVDEHAARATTRALAGWVGVHLCPHARISTSDKRHRLLRHAKFRMDLSDTSRPRHRPRSPLMCESQRYLAAESQRYWLPWPGARCR